MLRHVKKIQQKIAIFLFFFSFDYNPLHFMHLLCIQFNLQCVVFFFISLIDSFIMPYCIFYHNFTTKNLWNINKNHLLQTSRFNNIKAFLFQYHCTQSQSIMCPENSSDLRQFNASFKNVTFLSYKSSDTFIFVNMFWIFSPGTYRWTLSRKYMHSDWCASDMTRGIECFKGSNTNCM